MSNVHAHSRIVASLLAALVSSAAFADPSYTVVSVLRIGDQRTTALAVNDLGQVAGFHAYTGTYSSGKKTKNYQGWSAFLTSGDGASVTEVVPLTGQGTSTGSGSSDSSGTAGSLCGGGRGVVFTSALTSINADGVAAGESTVAVTKSGKTTYVQHAVLYTNGSLVDLGALGGTTSFSTAAGVNASGIVVGTSGIAGSWLPHAFVYDGTTLADLGTLGGKTSFATALNDAGTIVGGSTLVSGALHPFRYSGGTMTDLGLPSGFTFASATAISSTGSIVGSGDFATKTGNGKRGKTVHSIHAFLWDGSTFSDLGSLYTNAKSGLAAPLVATGINASGTIVGNTTDASGKPRAFVYQDGTLYDLNAALPSDYAGYTLVSASSITDGGYVSTTAIDASGKQYALILKLG